MAIDQNTPLGNPLDPSLEEVNYLAELAKHNQEKRVLAEQEVRDDARYKYIQAVNENAEQLLTNVELMDLVTYCEDAIGEETKK